jgi:16S rRNA processing protein RimM
LEKLDKLLSIGKILNFHGIQGEVKVGYSEGQENFLTEVTEIYAVKDLKATKLTPEKIRFHKNTAIIKFKEINSIDDVMELKGALLKTLKSEITELLEEDEFYIDDLTGLQVLNQDGELIGEVSGVSVSTGQDLLFIKDLNNKEHIVPFVKDIVPEVNMKEKKIVIKPIEGLLE